LGKVPAYWVFLGRRGGGEVAKSLARHAKPSSKSDPTSKRLLAASDSKAGAAEKLFVRVDA